MSFRIGNKDIAIGKGQGSRSKRSNYKLDNNFRTILNERLDKKKKVKISAHAQERLEERNIKLENRDMNLINKAIENLEEKGARESLMLYKDMALIASVNNRTIITALKAEDMDIVTNIDSAVRVK